MVAAQGDNDAFLSNGCLLPRKSAKNPKIWMISLLCPTIIMNIIFVKLSFLFETQCLVNFHPGFVVCFGRVDINESIAD